CEFHERASTPVRPGRQPTNPLGGVSGELKGLGCHGASQVSMQGALPRPPHNRNREYECRVLRTEHWSSVDGASLDPPTSRRCPLAVPWVYRTVRTLPRLAGGRTHAKRALERRAEA